MIIYGSRVPVYVIVGRGTKCHIACMSKYMDGCGHVVEDVGLRTFCGCAVTSAGRRLYLQVPEGYHICATCRNSAERLGLIDAAKEDK